MATPTIPNGEEYFFNILYEGNGGGQRVGKFVPFTDNGTIDNSLIFNDGDSPSLARTPSSGGDRRTWTFSAWIKRGNLTGAVQYIFSASDSASSTKYDYIYFDTDNTIDIQHYNGSGTEGRIKTNRTFEDTSKFYHLFYVFDSTNATAGNRMRLYIDGDEITSFSIDTNPSLNYETDVNDTTPQTLGKPGWASAVFFDGYMAEVNLIDGTALTPDTFGVTDTSTGRWIPKTLSGITYGTNGFRLKFQDSSALGDDTSGNGNDLSATNLASTDQTTDSPTQNFSILASNPTAGTATLSEGNLKIAGTGSSVYGVRRASFLINSNDSNGYYFEAKNVGSSTDNINIGLISSQNALSASAYGGSNSYGIASRGSGGSNQYWRVLGGSTDVTTSVSHASNDVIGVAIKQGKIWFAINNTWVLSGDPANGTNSFFDMSSKASEFQIAFNVFQNNTLDVNFGQKSLSYTAPTGFSALQQDNLPTTAKGTSGLVWTKNRDSTDNHQLYDSSRGKQLVLASNATTDETTVTDGLQKFLAGGQQIEDSDAINTSNESYVSWNWVANGGTTASNTDGSITSTVQANTTAGFSIIQWTGLGGGTGRTIGHGLSSAPEWIVVKNLTGSSGYNWNVYHIGTDASNPSDYFVSLNTTSARDNSVSTWNDTAPTSSVFSVNHEATAGALGNEMIAYCWHGVDGFSKFGKYTGNGSSDDGPFIYTGFRPAWLMYKGITEASQWDILDNKRNPFNPQVNVLSANLTNADRTPGSYNSIDFLSNGFKIRALNDGINKSGNEFIYMAFAEHPFVGDGTNPVTAR
jgi:hypothetical protein